MKAFSILCSLLAITVIKAEGDDVRPRPNPEFMYPDGAAIRTAVAEFNDGGVAGVVKFTQSGRRPVILAGVLRGLTPGLHGFHIHEFGNISTGCAAAGAHFNPEHVNHGDRQSSTRHVGDLGNILANSSETATIAFEDPVIQLTGRHGIVGRALVIHEKADDGGLGGDEESTKTGNAGRRIACATIRPRFPPGPWPEQNSAPRWRPEMVVLLSLFAFILARAA